MSATTKRVALAGALSLALVIPSAGSASAGPDDIPGTAGAATLTDTPEPERPAFYEPPEHIPSTPGTIIRTEPATFLLDPLGLSSKVVTATRVMYSSTDVDGNPIAVTGTVFVPKTKYIGASKRPLISYTAGTQGMADACAPSRQMSELVEYEGIGIAPEDQDLVFERFRVTEAARERGGTGIGLPIVRAIARAHGGDVTVSSRPGVGSCFTLDIPREPPSETPSEEAQP